MVSLSWYFKILGSRAEDVCILENYCHDAGVCWVVRQGEERFEGCLGNTETNFDKQTHHEFPMRLSPTTKRLVDLL